MKLSPAPVSQASWRHHRAYTLARQLLLACTGFALLYPGLAICEYGSLPGMMEHSPTAPFSLTWRLFDPACQLKDEIARFLGPPPWLFSNRTKGYELWAAGARTKMVPNFGPQVNVSSAWQPAPEWAHRGEPIRMMVFGDSVDANLILDVCAEATAHGIPAGLRGFGNNCPACSLPHVSFHAVEQFIPGNWPTGPYLGEYTSSHAPQLAFPRGFQDLMTVSGDIRPSIVVFNGLLWDLGRLHTHNKFEHSLPILSNAFVGTYMTFLNTWMAYMEAVVPADALLVYHNAAYPRLKDCRVGTNHHHEVTGDQLHIMALNAAGKQVVSQRPRWHLIDYGQMSEATMLDSAHLRDSIHPNAAFTAQAFNILLNLYREHKLALHG